jgi:hypothetical protein
MICKAVTHDDIRAIARAAADCYRSVKFMSGGLPQHRSAATANCVRIMDVCEQYLPMDGRPDK